MSNKVEGAVSSDSSYSIPRKVQMNFTLKNLKGEALKDVEFWTYVPVNQTSTQKVVKIDTTHQHKLQKDEIGNQVMFFNFSVMPPYAVKTVNIEVELMLSESSKKISNSNLRKYLRPEKYCESDDPAIISLADKLKNANQEKSAKNIYRWISKNIVYTGYTKNTRGARYALDNKKGDCTEYACLFTALCRACEIPARTVGGFVCSGDSVLKPREYHNWAEFYDDNSWKLSDPQKKVFSDNQSDYIVLKILDESGKYNQGKNRGLFGCSNDGVELKMNG